MTPTYPTSLFEAATVSAVPEDNVFYFFPKLPIELRRLIWTTCLQQQRIITIKIVPETGSDDGYHVEAQRRYRHSKLLRVCHEARIAALEFYSLRIPCTNLDACAPLYFSPEYDVLHIDQERYDGLGWFVDLLPKLATYDSQGVGVLNLATNRRVLSPKSDLNKGLLKPPALRKAFAQAVSRLRRLWVVVLENSHTRAMAGGLSWLDTTVHHNRAVPVFPLLQAFTRLPNDPRPIERDLGHIATFYHPQELVDRWRQLEKELRISRAKGQPPLELQVLLAVDATRPSELRKPIVDRSTAKKFMEEEERWFQEDLCSMFDVPVPYWGNYLSKEEWEGLRQSLPDAVGFWLFQADAFGHFPNNGTTIKRVRDLRDHPPELCVFDMS
ncbi:hypothetical protein PG993_014171 [Apiospora rasikravindrae]|uniref:2EXR domain-containing protein n=1 Tax=Apiospora rasikravindrae TaxID=990691 RepID=A0ABR1RSA0_9PEZI